MAVLKHLFLGILILHIYVHAAPSDVSKLEEIANVKKDGENLDPVKEVEENASSIETVREKRFYPYGPGFPPINPFIFPSYNKRDDFRDSSNFDVDDPLAQIYRHVQDIASFVRQPQPPRIPPPHVPIFYPVLFVPPFDCNCNINNYQPTDQPTDQPTESPSDRPTEPSTDQPNDQTNHPTTFNGDEPDQTNLTNRFKETDDERRIWGQFINTTGVNPNQFKPEFSRPISFDPISINQATERPVPPVDHGTIQSDANGNQVPSRPENEPPSPPPNSRPPPPTTIRPPGGPFNSRRPPTTTRRPQNAQKGYKVPPPTSCESAIIACCHQPLITYDCFAVQGCPNINSYGNPCEINSILRIIQKVEKFYASRSGQIW